MSTSCVSEVLTFTEQQIHQVAEAAIHPEKKERWPDDVLLAMAYLQGELERLDPEVRYPLPNFTWPRDVPAKVGEGRIEGALNWANILRISMDDVMEEKTQSDKGEKTWRVEDLINNGIRLNWNKTLDLLTYEGHSGAYGLLNDPEVVAIQSAHKIDHLATLEYIQGTFDEIMKETWMASERDITGMATDFLLPPKQFSCLALRRVRETMSILEYLIAENYSKQAVGSDLIQDVSGNFVAFRKRKPLQIRIWPCRHCITAGPNGQDRMMAYINNPDRALLEIPVPLVRVMTQPKRIGDRIVFDTVYVGQVKPAKHLYPKHTVMYLDGI